MSALISVIVPIYNTEKYLDRCIQSILSQTYTNLEIILIDDGSTDSSSSICARYACLDQRVKVIHKANGGQGSARNVGLSVSKGEYIGFVDSDDWIESTMYETLLHGCIDKKGIAFVGVDEVTEAGQKLLKVKLFDGVVSTEEFLRNILIYRGGVSVCSKLFPKAIIGTLRFNEVKLNEDALFVVDLIKRAEYVSYISVVGYHYFRRSGSSSRQFGKAVYDMVDNSTYIRKYVEREFPNLSKEAERFELFQHMSFLLSCPSDHNRKDDLFCRKVLRYLRGHMLQGLTNPYLARKDKLKFLGTALCPRGMSKLIEYKNRRKQCL